MHSVKTTAKRKGRPRNARLASDLLEAVLGGTLKDLDGLFKSGANVNPRAKDGFTSLMLAIGRKDPRITACLIEQGADVKARNEIGQTPLMIAALSGQRAIAEQLIAAGADVRAVDNEKRNAISWAASRGDFPEVISLLGVSGGERRTRSSRNDPADARSIDGLLEVSWRPVNLGGRRDD